MRIQGFHLKLILRKLFRHFLIFFFPRKSLVDLMKILSGKIFLLEVDKVSETFSPSLSLSLTPDCTIFSRSLYDAVFLCHYKYLYIRVGITCTLNIISCSTKIVFV
jgi:hypothetical protein